MNGERAAFPWEAVLHAGLCRMRLSAKDFWAMTPRELAFALGVLRPVPSAPGRNALAALMRAFPDHKE
ncbi:MULTISPECIES: rcc01693 family protein [unclassified Shinella]|uniref:rcc01693 family protein n=1 Tax=unclassified Shinella TaxID=2643062 RepID=UPI00055C3173|nr:MULTISPECIES: rcc01693 family protein [unclassified Shinella]MCO5150426.1 phage tail assembly chaperone [Shinella sp.]MDG4671354.1 phage tail assembly chaperone [Shinella sp. 838]